METLIAIVLGLCLLASPLVIVVLLLRGAARNTRTRERVDALELKVERLSDRLEELFEAEPVAESMPAASAVSIDSARVPTQPVVVPTPIGVIPPPIVVAAPSIVVPPPIAAAPPPIDVAPRRIVVPRPIVSEPRIVLPQPVEALSPAEYLAKQEIKEDSRPVYQTTAAAKPSIAWSERLAGTDWEALVGGNWLNKAGVLVFIIGLSLFLGYSLTQFGPIGRVSIGWVISIGLLAAGTILERRPGYGLFGRGLLAGGWAGAYFTSYAMYALPAARVIESPIAGTALLMSVAAGMVIHSLQYRSEALTGLTYFIAFATLNIAPVNSFTLLASAPLAASLLTIAYRQRWTTMSVVGVIFTYGSLMMRMATSTTSATVDELRIVQAILVTYWLLFELFDLIDLRRRTSPALSATLFPLNATGFLGLSVLLWSNHPGASAYLYGMSAIGYLASAILRAFVAPARAAAGASSEPEWQVARGYEAAVTVASALAAATIGLTFHGIQLSTALALEGELLLLSGLRLKKQYVRGLASVVLMGALLTTLPVLTDASINTFLLFGTRLHVWTPLVMLIAAAFYMNAALVRSTKKIAGEWGYLGGATALLIGVIGYNTPLRYLGIAWFVLAMVLLEAGIRAKSDELRRHGYAVGVLATLPFAVVVLQDRTGETWWPTTLLVGAVMAYAMTIRLARQGPTVPASEQVSVREIASPAAAFFSAAAIWYLVPHQYAGLVCLPLAWALLEVGLFAWEECLFQAVLIGLVSVCHILATTEGRAGAAHPSLMLGAAALFTGIGAVRLFRLGSVDRQIQQTLRDAAALASIIFLTTCAWHVLPAAAVALAWGAIALALVDIGRSLRWKLLAGAGDALAVIVFARLFTANMTADGSLWGLSTRLLTIAPAVPLFYYLASRHSSTADLEARTTSSETDGARTPLSRTFMWMGSALIFALLRFELGRVFTVAGWSVFAVVLLSVGLRRRDADVRNQGYLVAAAAALRGWITNFEAPDFSGGLPIEILLAAIVVACLYLCQFLVPREWSDAGTGAEMPRRWIDRHARELFGVVATALLATVLFHDVPSRLVTVAWALQGLMLLAAGFPAREPILRRSGLVLLAVCVTKVLAYDSRQLDTLARIISFMLLGSVLIVVSWIYTHFGSRLRRYL